MVVPGKESSRLASVQEVAIATLRCFLRHVPVAVPGIVFLSGGQEERVATAHLNAINQLPGAKPWTISFSYGRALQDLKAGQQALYHRARCNKCGQQRDVHRRDGGRIGGREQLGSPSRVA
jgi:fructose-bisphosphate aldolase, class I